MIRRARSGRRACGRLLLGCLLALAPATLPAAQPLPIDGSRSHADFHVRVFWIRSMGGRFDRIGGEATRFDDGRSMRIRAWIDATSVDMHKPRYERWLLSPEFFDARRYPRIRFMSAAVPTSELVRGGPLHGLVTIRGVTRFANFTVQPVHCPAPGLAPCRVRVRGHIQRSDFGMDRHRTIISDRVGLDLVITLQAPLVVTPFGPL